MDAVLKEIIEHIKGKQPTKDELGTMKTKICKKHHSKIVPNDIQLLMNAPSEYLPILKNILMTKPVRSLSGVAVVALMTKPWPCPHGACLMCPSVAGMPQSYTGTEPSTRRGVRNAFDAYLMTMSRIEQYVACGHQFDKIELIIQGGTFTSMPVDYQEGFIRDAFGAMNDFSSMFMDDEGGLRIDSVREFFELPGSVKDEERGERLRGKILALKEERVSGSTLAEEQKINDTSSKIKCVGLTIETRADWAKKEHADRMLAQGCTRVEIGIQSVYDDVLERIQRGHGTKENIDAVRLLRDIGFKLNFHYMPGLPGVDKARDLEGMKKLFSDSEYRPDMLKLYPCMVLKDSKLYSEWKEGKFKPLTTLEAAELMAEAKGYVEPYCRVMRVQRDIPPKCIEAGPDKTNLRQDVVSVMKAKGIVCRCIRCREVGRTKDQSEPTVRVMEYEASLGREFFISIENDSSLFGFVRLRFPSQYGLRPEIVLGSALIRELHVYGKSVRIGGAGEEGGGQHHGLGRQLMETAERIALEKGMKKMVVISGVGVRGYYRKLGYELEGDYMVKRLGGQSLIFRDGHN